MVGLRHFHRVQMAYLFNSVFAAHAEVMGSKTIIKMVQTVFPLGTQALG